MLTDKFSDLRNRIKARGKQSLEDKFSIYIHRKIAALIDFDDEPKRFADNIEQFVKNGERDMALRESRKMEHYLKFQAKFDRKYRSKLAEVTEALEDNSEQVEKVYERFEDSRFVEFLEANKNISSSYIELDETALNKLDYEVGQDAE